MWKTKLGVLLSGLSLIAVACGSVAIIETTTTRSVSTTVGATATVAPSTTAGPAATFPVTIAAANGQVVVPSIPTRIVSLSATHTEMLYAIGAGEQVIAVDAFSNYPNDTPTTELSGFAPNVEAIVELEADLVVIDGDWDGNSVAALTELEIPVLVLEAATSLNDVYTQIERLGVATDHTAEAAILVGQMQTDIAEILASLPATNEPRTFYHELDTTYFSVTTETFIGQIYASMGLVNIADEVGEGSFGYPQLSEEYIIEQDPDLIFLADTICCGVNAVSIAERPGWAGLTAAKTGSVVELSDDVASRWGPRIVEYMRAIADAVSLIGASP